MGFQEKRQMIVQKARQDGQFYQTLMKVVTPEELIDLCAKHGIELSQEEALGGLKAVKQRRGY